MENPHKVDILTLLGDRPKDCAHLLFGDSCLYELQGCKALRNARSAIRDTLMARQP